MLAQLSIEKAIQHQHKPFPLQTDGGISGTCPPNRTCWDDPLCPSRPYSRQVTSRGAQEVGRTLHKRGVSADHVQQAMLTNISIHLTISRPM